MTGSGAGPSGVNKPEHLALLRQRDHLIDLVLRGDALVAIFAHHPATQVGVADVTRKIDAQLALETAHELREGLEKVPAHTTERHWIHVLNAREYVFEKLDILRL